MGIEELSDAELANKFKELTNEAAEDILEMSSKGMSSVNLKTLLHYTILLANETGALETNLDLHYLRMLPHKKKLIVQSQSFTSRTQNATKSKKKSGKGVHDLSGKGQGS